jgi:membrane protease YdiL (CAAX protease family)
MSVAQGLPPTAAGRSRPAPTGGDVLMGLTLSGVLFLLLAFGIGVVHATGAAGWLMGPWGLLLQLALANLVLFGAALAVAARRGWSVFAFSPLPGRVLALCAAGGAVGGIALAFVLSTVSSVTGLPLHAANEELMSIEGFSPLGMALFAVIAAGTTPLAEELIFRGLLFQWLRGRLSVAAGAAISATLFGALHWPSGQALGAGLVGVGLALVFHRLNSLWASIAAHSGINALAMVLVMVFMG